MRDNAPDDGESRCNTSMPLVVEASRSITSPAPVPQAKRHLFPVLASQQAQRISALVRYDAVGAEEDEEAAMHRTRTILPLPLLSWLTVASWRLLTATAVTGLGSGITLKLVQPPPDPIQPSALGCAKPASAMLRSAQLSREA